MHKSQNVKSVFIILIKFVDVCNYSLLENGLMMFMWIGLGVNPDWVRNVFGVPSAAQIDIDKVVFLTV